MFRNLLNGEVAERSKALDWNSSNILTGVRGFESHPLRHRGPWWSAPVPSRRHVVNPVRPGRQQRQRSVRVPKFGWCGPPPLIGRGLMAYTALARKWRPHRFTELIGQEHVRPRAQQCARWRPRAPRLSVYRHARGRQDHGGAHSGQVPELRERRQRRAVRRVRELHGNRCRPHRRSDRGRRRLAHQGRRYARAARQRAVRADPRPLQDLPDRRSAHALGALLQRAC